MGQKPTVLTTELSTSSQKHIYQRGTNDPVHHYLQFVGKGTPSKDVQELATDITELLPQDNTAKNMSTQVQFEGVNHIWVTKVMWERESEALSYNWQILKTNS